MKAVLVLPVIMATMLCFQPVLLLLASPPPPQKKLYSSAAAGAVETPSSANHVVVERRMGGGGGGGGRGGGVGSGSGRIIPIYGGGFTSAQGHGKGHRSGSDRRFVGDIKLPAALFAVLSIVLLFPT